MSDTTTIEIRDEQRDELKALKQHDRESYKSVIDRLLDGDTPDEPSGLDELRERLDRIESAAATAEERTGSIEKTLESAGLGR